MVRKKILRFLENEVRKHLLIDFFFPPLQLIMEDSHKGNTSETTPQPGSTVQGAHISHIAQQVRQGLAKILSQLVIFCMDCFTSLITNVQKRTEHKHDKQKRT